MVRNKEGELSTIITSSNVLYLLEFILTWENIDAESLYPITNLGLRYY